MQTIGDVVQDEKLIQIAVMNSYLAGARETEQALVADAVSAFIDQIQDKYGLAIAAEDCEALVDMDECDAGTQLKCVQVEVHARARQPQIHPRGTRRARRRAALAV